MLDMILLSRDDFRNKVFARDNHRCVICGAAGQDAHHILERRLWPDGGYYLENGATLCGGHHLEAERTTLSCEQIREAAGIKCVLLPPHLYDDQPYDKWGNPVLPNGRRLKGELADDESVKKVISASVEFSTYVKYPRTYHLPWSPGVSKDDRVKTDMTWLSEGEIVVTEKMDGENTTMYQDHIHARSIDSAGHPSRDRVKAIWSTIAHDIPEGWRICGENLYAQHSIAYQDLPGYFLVFSVWNERNICLSWAETVEWAALFGLPTVKVLYGPAPAWLSTWRVTDPHAVWGVGEGYVVRRAEAFHYSEFRHKVAKWVRKDHVHTHGHWMKQVMVPNKLVNP